MSRFQIKAVFPEEERSDGHIPEMNVRAVGSTSLQSDSTRLIGKLADGKLKYLTGLKRSDILMSPLLNKEEKEIYSKQLEKDIEVLNMRFRPEEYDETNTFFWKDLNMGKVVLDSSIEDKIFDTDAEPKYIILKYGILASSYDTIAPSREAALLINAPFYMTTLEAENEKKMIPISDKLRAYKELNDFVVSSNEESVILFSWALNEEKLKGFTFSNSKAVITEQLVDYLEGKLVKGAAKKKCVEKVLNQLEEWKVDPNEVKIRATVLGSHFYSSIFFDKGFYFTSERRTKLGSTIEETVNTLKDPINRDELLELKEKFKEELKK